MAEYDTASMNFRDYQGYQLNRRDPFGYWYVTPKSGKLPPELDQAFTETRYATNAIDTFLKKVDKTKKG